MEEEEKNKETEQNNINNKQNISENGNNLNNISEAFRPVNNQKIKINEEKLKDTNIKKMEIQSELSTSQNPNQIDITPKNNTLIHSTLNFTNTKKYYFKINRCLTPRLKKIILIIFLVISIIFVFISVFDMIMSLKKLSYFQNNKFLMNNIFVFIFQIGYALSLLLFQGITIVLEKKDNIAFNIFTIIIILIGIIVRTIIFIKNDDKNSTMLYNLFFSLCLTIINLGIFIYTLKLLKMKKNVQQNIEEIINFTDALQATNSKINEQKDNQIILNNSVNENKEGIENNKQGITSLVEEKSDNNNNSNNVNEIDNKK